MARDKALVKNHEYEEEEFLDEESFHRSKPKVVVAANGRSGRGGGGGSSKKRMRSIFIDDVAEEADDDDDDEEEEQDDDYYENDYGNGKRKRRQTSAAAPFIDDEVVVASSDEESTDGEGEELGEPFVVSDAEILQEGREDSNRWMGHGQQPHWFPNDEEEEDVEEMERRIHQRYQSYAEELDEVEIDDVQQRSLLPSVRDSKLWAVKCAFGREREAAVCLMQKCIIDQVPGMHIKSAISLDHLQNYVYVEADKEAYVREACKGFNMLDTRRIVRVPIKEMTDVVSVKGKAVDLVKGMWVRMKIGVYKGDIAKVVSVPDSRRRVMVKLIPRIDLQALSDKLEGKNVSKKAFVPFPHLMNLDAARQRNIPIVSRRERRTGTSFDVVDGNMFNGGFLYKTVSMKSIQYRNIQPSVNELENFCEPGHGIWSSVSSAPENRRKCPFVKGDVVIVVRGDLINLTGRVEKVEEDNIHIKPNRKDLHTTIVVSEKCICKYFKLGDHVKVVSGAHEGSFGTVIKTDRNVLIIVSDATREYISVLAEHVVESSEVTSGAITRIGDYELHDLVMLGDMSFGVIIRLEREALQVLKGDPGRTEVASVKLRDIRYKIWRRSTAQDRYDNTVSVKDVVKILTGPCKGKQGPVEHIHRGILFVKDRHHMEHSGFICVKADSCLVMGSSHTKVSPSSAYIPPAPRSYSRGPPLDSGERHGRGGLRGHDSFVGSTVKILFGPYKGCRGRVLSRNGQSVRVELESQMQTVAVKREEVSVDALCETPQCGIRSETSMRPAQTPVRPYMTPMRDQGGQTPAHCGMRTPMRHQAWNPYAIRTPVWGTSPALAYKAPALITASGWD